MENGGLSDKLADLTLNDAKDNSLFQVMKAVEAAEATIKQQVEENNKLRAQLHKKIQELENIKSDWTVAQRPQLVEPLDGHGQGGIKSLRREPTFDPQLTLLLGHDSAENSEDHAKKFHTEHHTGINMTNGSLNMLPQRQTNVDNSGISRLSSPSNSPFSPGRYPADGEYDTHMNVARQGLMPLADANNSGNFLKQDLVQKVREQEQEIIHLTRHLTECSVKEAQIRNEKYLLEKRIAAMRMAFDQQQQDLVDAASKALSYRQDIIEENVRITYALQDAQQERTIFVSSLLPLLAEYSLQPPVLDAQSIVSSVKVLFKHLQEKLIMTESKLKDPQYQLTPWRANGSNPNLASQSPQHFSGAGLTSGKNGLELVPQNLYSSPNLVTSDARMSTDWDIGRQHVKQMVMSSPVVKGAELDEMGRYLPIASSFRNPAARDMSPQVAVAQDERHGQYYTGETMNRHVKFKDPVSGLDMDESDAEVHHSEREHSANWGAGSSPYINTADEPSSSYSPYLQPVPEDPSSSFSEVADDDPLPAIEGLQISGEAFPGYELQACGYSINGTTSCNFEWVRHLEDGSVNYIDGAKQPTYLVTADDVETYLAIEVQPLDDRKRKGELVKVFANDHRKITVDPVMHTHIQKNLDHGQASYKVSLSTGYLDLRELATLTIKREGYSVKCSRTSGVVTEKFSPASAVTVMHGHPLEFSIMTADGAVQILRAENTTPDIVSLRDLIVLTLRYFIAKAGEKRKGKKRSLFFNK